MTILAITHIERTPDICGGAPRVAGTRVRIQDIASWHEAGASPDEMAEQFDLTSGQVHAALSYYYDHRREIIQDLERSKTEADRLLREGWAVRSDHLEAQIQQHRNL